MENDFIKTDQDSFRSQINDLTIVLEPKRIFNAGIIGYCESKDKLVYSLSLLIESIMINDNIDYIEALDFLMYNTVSFCKYFEEAPILINDIDDYQDE